MPLWCGDLMRKLRAVNGVLAVTVDEKGDSVPGGVGHQQIAAIDNVSFHKICNICAREV